MQQQKLNDYHQKNIAVALENCEVKPARQGEGYEVMLKSSTVILTFFADLWQQFYFFKKLY